MRIFERDGFKCLYCGQGALQGVVLEVDHVVPKSRGGSNRDDNLCSACYACNRGKRDKIMVPPGWDEKIKDVPERVKRKIPSRPFRQSRPFPKPPKLRTVVRCSMCKGGVSQSELRRCPHCNDPYHESDCIYEHLGDGGSCNEIESMRKAREAAPAPAYDDEGERYCESCDEEPVWSFCAECHRDLCDNCMERGDDGQWHCGCTLEAAI